MLAPHDSAPFFVFHDAYQYFESRFGLATVGALSLGDASNPSAGRLNAIREAVADHGAACIFTEPQFDKRLALTAVEGSGAPLIELDPIGLNQRIGPDLYPALITAMGRAMADCIGGKS